MSAANSMKLLEPDASLIEVNIPRSKVSPKERGSNSNTKSAALAANPTKEKLV